jgi:G3E family GTPase
MKKVPFFLVTGFLGSGKTSLLTDLVRKYTGGMKIAIVQNEFTPGHVDGIVLKNTGETFGLLEINNGSVFCACLLGDFIDQLEPFIRKHRPDVIVLEATGLADPVSLGQVLQAPRLEPLIYLAGSWCLVDAVNYHRIAGSVLRARQQVRMADTVWINKTDLVDDTASVRDSVRELNPFAKIIETTFGRTDAIDLNAVMAMEPKPVPEPKPGEPRPQMGACVIRSTRFFDEERLLSFIREQTGSVYRMKGYIRLDKDITLAVQTVFHDLSFQRIKDYEGPCEFIAMGPELKYRDFSHQFLSLQK